MLMKAKDLDPNKYYHCVAQSHPGSIWLCKGKTGYIFLGNKLGNNSPYFSGSGDLSSTTDWEVREATEEEKIWISDSIREQQLALRRTTLEVYQIF